MYAALSGIFFCKSHQTQAQTNMDIQGHRGCRGLMPENSIPAFLKALDLGVTTLEMDAVVSKDGKVVVSHEPFMSHIICEGPDGEKITEENEKEYNIYAMIYDEISQCDCGILKHPDYPEQQKMRVIKPLLSEVIEEVEAYISEKSLTPVRYNIETKSSPEGDNEFHPAPNAFVDLLMGVIEEGNIDSRTTIQSFDVRTLQYAHQEYPEMELALLVGNNKSPQENLEILGFTPEIYSPYFKLVNGRTVQFARNNNMKIVPWTVNNPKDIRKMIALEVDGIISDYPNRVIESLQ